MAEIRLIRDADAPWEEVSPAWHEKQREGDPGLRFKRLLPSVAGMPNLQRTEYRPHHHEAPHSHPEDEIIFVLGGRLFFGRDELGFGDAIFVPRDKTYSLRTDESGAAFVRIGLSDLRGASGEDD